MRTRQSDPERPIHVVVYGPDALLQEAFCALLANLPGIDVAATTDPLVDWLASSQGRRPRLVLMVYSNQDDLEAVPEIDPAGRMWVCLSVHLLGVLVQSRQC